MKMRETDPATSNINTFSRVLSKLSSQEINFEEEVKDLALLSSFPTIWEGILHDIHQQLPKLNLKETIDQVVTEDIRRKSMGLTIDDSQLERVNQSVQPIEKTSRENRLKLRSTKKYRRPTTVEVVEQPINFFLHSLQKV